MAVTSAQLGVGEPGAPVDVVGMRQQLLEKKKELDVLMSQLEYSNALLHVRPPCSLWHVSLLQAMYALLASVYCIPALRGMCVFLGGDCVRFIIMLLFRPRMSKMGTSSRVCWP